GTGESLIQNLSNTGVIDSTYTISLTATNNRGCMESTQVDIVVHPDARAEITSLQEEACIPFTINSSIISARLYPDANTTDYLWEIDSAGTIVGSAIGVEPPVYTIVEENISVTYNLTAFSKYGCADNRASFTFRSFPAAEAAFTLAETSFCEDDEVFFTNRSQNSVRYQWDFGDGSSSAMESPSHRFENDSFTKDSLFTVRLVSETANNCTDESSTIVTVHPKPFASFSTNGVCAGETLTVLNESFGKGDLTYKWTVVPTTGISIADERAFEPVIALEDNQGTDQQYQLTLEVTSEDLCVETFTRTVTITARPEANFDVAELVCVDVPVTFSNLSVNASDVAVDSLFIWDFGDGSVDSITSATDPLHTYSDTGTYVIRLVAVNANSCRDMFEKSIRVIAPAAPKINYVQVPETGCAPVVVTFNSDSSLVFNTNESYFWDFGNGNTSTDANPDPEPYLQNDQRDTTYVVTLMITNSCRSVTDSAFILVKPQPIADFSIVPFNAGCDDVPITLLNESKGLPQLFIWDYGDGVVDSMTSREPHEHIYQNNTEEDIVYTVTLTTVNECGVDSTTRNVTIVPFNDNATIKIEDDDGLFCVGESLTAIIAGLGGESGRLINWTFDGVPLEHNDTVSVPLNEVGIFDLIVQVEVLACGGTVRDTMQIEVQKGPDIDFTFAENPVCTGSPVEIVNLGPTVNPGTLWDFGDGSVIEESSIPSPHFYEEAGTYTVTM
ncbi:MAG: PKD domain-containing protein, partial [Cyclobacteriaceae bacterium]